MDGFWDMSGLISRQKYEKTAYGDDIPRMQIMHQYDAATGLRPVATSLRLQIIYWMNGASGLRPVATPLR